LESKKGKIFKFIQETIEPCPGEDSLDKRLSIQTDLLNDTIEKQILRIKTYKKDLRPFVLKKKTRLSYAIRFTLSISNLMLLYGWNGWMIRKVLLSKF
jgi:hypothetical protein